MKNITEFKNENRWLSNMWPCEIWYGGLRFNSVEHAYVAAKTTDGVERLKIKSIEDPHTAKKYGRKLKLRDNWDTLKLGYMEAFLIQKFDPEIKLGQKLIATSDVLLVEGNCWNDTFWGVCKGKGENNLGKLLMKIRAENQSKSNPNTTIPSDV